MWLLLQKNNATDLARRMHPLLCRVATQQHDGDLTQAMAFVIGQPDPEQAELSKMMRIFLGAVIKLLPGSSESTLVVRLINKAIESMG
jgi:hypothetical protein